MRAISYMLVIFCLSSCEGFFDTIIEIDPPGHKPQLSVHAYGGNSNGGDVKIKVSRTFGILEDVNFSLLDSVSITLSSGGKFFNVSAMERNTKIFDTLNLVDTSIIYSPFDSDFNYYSSDFVLEPGKTYTLNVSHPGFQPVRAQQTAPNEVRPDSAIFVRDAGLDQSGYNVSAIDIYFQDPPGEDNFYEIRLLRKIGPSLSSPYVESAEPGSIVNDLRYILLNDKVFNGQSKRFRMTFYNIYSGFDAGEYIVRWRSISPETFKFNEAMTKYFNSVDNPFLTPTQIYSNIENGVGIFSLYHETLIETRE